MTQFRQGDVLLCAVEDIPVTATPLPCDGDRVVLASGEASGHAHAMPASRARMLRDPASGRVFVTVAKGGARLRHEEHAAILVPRGRYELLRQREYTPEAPRLVRD